MTSNPPRLRVFAGPNGSGKTTILNEIKTLKGSSFLGVVINADEIEKELSQTGFLELSQFNLKCDEASFKEAFRKASWIHQKGHLHTSDSIFITNNKIHFKNYNIDSYISSVIADHLRNLLLDEHLSFTFETVMSAKDKVVFIQKALNKGYRVYLYFIALSDADLSISRVENRVYLGGHAVPSDIIRSRYQRSIDNLYLALKFATRAYIFDNSSNDEKFLIAELNENGVLELKSDYVPKWFNDSILTKLT